MIAATGHEWPYPGSRWWKFDFHTHTPASADYGKGGDQASLRRITPEDWLLGFMRAGVDCVAVTDHNSGEWIDRLKSALSNLEEEEHDDFRPLYLFPGVEVTANGNIHVLAVFDTDKESSDIDKLLGDVRYRGGPGESARAAEEAPIGVVEAIRKAGAIPILAHVDGPSGAWQLSGNTLGPLLDSDGLFAIEVVDRNSEQPDLYRQSANPWAEVLGSDSHHPVGRSDDRFPGSHYTWVKMAKPSLDGLRLALLDGEEFSVRRSDAPVPFSPLSLPTHYIESIEIADARFMGRGQPEKLSFSPWLNALVGGRGTGKSTVIHAFRLSARREQDLEKLDEHSRPRLTFERFNRVPSNRTDEGGLTSSTWTEWTVMRDGSRHRVHWRRDGTGTVVEDDSGIGDWRPSPTQTVTPRRFPIRIFSQGEIAELAGDNQAALLRVIDEAAGVSALQARIDAARAAYFVSRARIRELDGRLKGLDDVKVELQDVERKLKRFEEAGHTAVLTDYRRRTRQRRETERQFDVADTAAGTLDDAATALQPEDLPHGLFDANSETDIQVTAIVAALGDAVRTAAREVHDVAQRLRESVQVHRETLKSSSWQAAVKRAVTGYDTLVESLQAEGVTDPDEYGRLVQERQRLEGEKQLLESRKEERAELVTQSLKRFGEVLEFRRAMSDARNEFLSTALAQNNFVLIEILPYGNDPLVMERSLREALDDEQHFQSDILVMEGDQPAKGCIAQLLVDLPANSVARRAELERRLRDLRKHMQSACLGAGGFRGHFNNYLERRFERSPDFLDKLFVWIPEDGLRVQYSRRGDGKDFQPIAQASAGQRSAAMLAFLLAHGDEPLVLDQPEDDLDNHLIYDLVVRQIRENKLRRQIIVVTHNPNIVVNGDAEMLHALDFRGGQCVVAELGSLQDHDMREEICRVMEGGREAFERRYRRLGREPDHVR